MRLIINRTQNHGTLDGVITSNSTLYMMVFKAIKQGHARLVIDTEETLMYIIG